MENGITNKYYLEYSYYYDGSDNWGTREDNNVSDNIESLLREIIYLNESLDEFKIINIYEMTPCNNFVNKCISHVDKFSEIEKNNSEIKNCNMSIRQFESLIQRKLSELEKEKEFLNEKGIDKKSEHIKWLQNQVDHFKQQTLDLKSKNEKLISEKEKDEKNLLEWFDQLS